MTLFYIKIFSVIFVRTLLNVSNVKLLGVNIDVELNFNHHIALLCKKAGRQINALSRYQMF